MVPILWQVSIWTPASLIAPPQQYPATQAGLTGLVNSTPLYVVTSAHGKSVLPSSTDLLYSSSSSSRILMISAVLALSSAICWAKAAGSSVPPREAQPSDAIMNALVDDSSFYSDRTCLRYAALLSLISLSICSLISSTAFCFSFNVSATSLYVPVVSSVRVALVSSRLFWARASSFSALALSSSES